MGRNAAQLRAAAEATGLFNGPRRQYVGDGYSVPWETNVGPVPVRFPSQYAFKLYLDTFFIEFSRLHDWLYTPYGKLINCTQEEADDALEEELSAVDPISGPIVGNACRYFGATFFGRSQVGYFGEQGTTFANNIGLAQQASPSNNGAGMAIKIVILFQQTTTFQPPEPSVNYSTIQRTAGWSESLYGPDSVSATIALLKGPRAPGVFPLLEARSNLLCNQASIIGARLYSGGAGKGQLLAASLNGSNGESDQPGASVHVSATSNATGQSRRWLLRGQPDNDIVNGEWNPDDQTVTRYQEYFASLAGLGWMAQVNTGQQTIFDIAPSGLVTATAALGFAVGNIVTIKNTTIVDSSRRIGGRYKVQTIGPGNNELTLKDWPDVYTQGGTISIVSSAFQDFASASLSVVRATFRKVGRPFAQYRGRRSTKKAAV